MPDRPEATPRFDKVLRALARPADIRSQPLPALQAIISMRVSAAFDRAGRDPLSEIALRLRSISAAIEFAELERRVKRAWPERFYTHRPGCLALCPDESTLAAMIRAAGNGDRASFGKAIEGFVRTDRHEALFDACIAFVAAIPAT